ncbi:MAG: hypothetical protein AAF495_20835 [Pseudomonadota bacterium]
MSEGSLCDPEDITEHTITFLNIDIGEERVSRISITYLGGNPDYRINVEIPDLLHQSFEANDVFECLIKLRRLIEPMGWRVLCNGARKDAYPSGMARDMGGGFGLYVLVLGRHALTKHLISTFDPCAAHQVGTIEEQKAFFRRWVRSPKPR